MAEAGIANDWLSTQEPNYQIDNIKPNKQWLKLNTSNTCVTSQRQSCHNCPAPGVLLAAAAGTAC
jgi:hypothetical protein